MYVLNLIIFYKYNIFYCSLINAPMCLNLIENLIYCSYKIVPKFYIYFLLL